MKKRILSWLLVLVMVLGMVPVMASAETASPEIVKANMTLNSILNVNFKVDFKGVDPSSYSVRITIGDTVTQTITQATQENGLYVYTANLLAHRMHETVTAELLNGETLVDAVDWTLSIYVDELQKAEPDNTALINLTNALKNYGAYAAYYAGKAEDPAVSMNVTADTLESYKQDIVKSGLRATAYLYLDDACDIGLKFNTADMEGKTLYVDGTAVETTALTETQVGYRIANILPQNWSKAYNVVVKEGENTAFEINYSVLSYARQALKQTTEIRTGLNGLMKSMYLYNQAAIAYQEYQAKLVNVTDYRTGSRAIYVSKTTPRLDLEFFVDKALTTELSTVVASGAEVFVNGKSHTVNISYNQEANGKGYITFSVENPDGWTPVEGGNDYATDPETNFDVLIPAGTQFANGTKLGNGARYVFNKSEGLSQNDTHPRKALSAKAADPDAYVLTTSVTGIRGGSRAIYVSKTTPRLDLEFYVDAALAEASGTVIAESMLVYVNGEFHNVPVTYYVETANSGSKYYIAFSVENPKGWTPVEGGNDYAADPAVTFDVLIPESTELGTHSLKTASRYIFTKTAGLEQTSAHPRKALSAEIADPDTYEYETLVTDVDITGVRGGSRAIYVSKTTPRLDLEFFVDGAVADVVGATAAEDTAIYLNGKSYIVDIVYQEEVINGQTKSYIQILIENPDGWTPVEGGNDYATDPAADFDILIPADVQFANGAKLKNAVRYIFTKSEGLEQTSAHPRKALTAVVANADDYEIINFVNSTGFRYGRAIYVSKATPRLDLEFWMSADLANTTGTEGTTYAVANNATVYVNGKPRIVNISYNASTYAIAFSVEYPYGWNPVEGGNDYATDPAVNFDVLIPAGLEFSDGHILENAVRYILIKPEGLTQNDTHPRANMTGEAANAAEYAFNDKVNVTGFRYGRTIFVSKATPRLDLEFLTDIELGNTTTQAAPYTVATNAKVYINQIAYNADITYNPGTKSIAFSVEDPDGWTPVEGEDNFATDPAVSFDVLIPAGTTFQDGTSLTNDVRYIVSKSVGLDASTAHPRKDCTAAQADPTDYFVKYVDVSGYRYGRTIFVSKTTPRLDVEFYVNAVIENTTDNTASPYPAAKGVTVYVNGTAYTVDMTYNATNYTINFSMENPTGWTPVEGGDNYASDPAVTFDVIIPAGTVFLDGHILKTDACYTITKSMGLDASTAHPRKDCTAVASQYIVKNGTTQYAIVKPGSSTAQENNAAAELELRFEEAVGTDIQVYKDSDAIPTGTKLISLGNTTYAQAALSDTSVASEGYCITTADENIYVLGNGYGVLEGTYELLNQLFGYEFYKAGVTAGADTNASDAYTLNTGVTNLTFKNIEKSAEPGITYMPTNYHGLREADHYRYTYNNEGELIAGTSSNRWHNTFLALNPKTYGEAHSGWYYAETSGFWLWQTTENIQLCYTAHGNETERQAMIDTAVDYYVALLQEYPTRSYVSFSMEDNEKWCNCSACNAAAQLYGSDSAAMLIMASEIRAGIMAEINDGRDIKVLTMIYRSCENLPAVANGGSYVFDTDFTADMTGIVPVWATMDTKAHAKGWNDAANVGARTMMAQLNALFDEFWVWDYAANFHDYLLPINTFDTIGADMQYLASQENLKLYLYQCDHDAGNSTGFGGLRTYLMSALRWNPDADVSVLTDNYFNAVYGAGAAAMKQIYTDYLNMTISNEGIYSDAMLTTSNWPKATVENWLTLIEQAKTAAAGDEEALENITVESIFVRYIYAVLYTDDAAFETELCNDVTKYFVRIGETEKRPASGLADKL